MVVIDTGTNESHKVSIEPVESTDFKVLTKKRYFFNWKEEKKPRTLYIKNSWF